MGHDGVKPASRGPGTPFTVRSGRDHLRGFFHDTGTGPVGVFLHGFRSTCDGTKSTALAHHAAARGFSWLRFDLHGHGASDGDFTEFRISRALDDVLQVLDWCPPRPRVLVGSSLGGWLAVLAAEHRPRVVTHLILIAPAFNFIQTYFQALGTEQLANWWEQGVMQFEDTFAGGQYPLSFDIIRDAQAYDVLDRPLTLNCPVEIVHGEHDEVIDTTVSVRFTQHVEAPHKVLSVVPGGDHRLVESVPMVMQRLDRIWSRADNES